MKHIIILLAALLMSVAGYADVVRNGNIITITKTTTLVNEKQSTGLYYQDRKGNQTLSISLIMASSMLSRHHQRLVRNTSIIYRRNFRRHLIKS